MAEYDEIMADIEEMAAAALRTAEAIAADARRTAETIDDAVAPATTAENSAPVTDTNAADTATANPVTDETATEDDDDNRPLDIYGNLMDNDNHDLAEETMARVAQDQAILKENGKTKKGSRGIPDAELANLKAEATAWVKTLFLHPETNRAVLKIIDNFTYWDKQFSSHTMVRRMRKDIERVGTLGAVLAGAVSDDSYWDDHYLKCKIIAIAAMVDPKGISIPHIFYSYRTGNDEMSKTWIDLLTQIQTLLHWTSNQRVRPPYIKGLAMPYRRPAPAPKKPAAAPKNRTPLPTARPNFRLPNFRMQKVDDATAAVTKKPARTKNARKRAMTPDDSEDDDDRTSKGLKRSAKGDQSTDNPQPNPVEIGGFEDIDPVERVFATPELLKQIAKHVPLPEELSPLP
ncbi:hypothetical protein VP1G_07215 [Cytospora mali]|uniref:Uncharacterized protein n=1 Tax=Cytospora mali TaxID=578113 RepID=A0A194V7H9_CYTMA|nr:hypothetical protein VP1G_07215 [Valsa mali var. pyri (nom. inval.)]